MSPRCSAYVGGRVAEVQVKFCGMTRSEDALAAIALGASYIGTVFAGGPRHLTTERAAELWAGIPADIPRVGVFGADALEQLSMTARTVGLAVVQLHGDPRAADIRAARARFGGQIWAVARADGSLLPDWTEELFREADAVLLDARVPGSLGGTGVTLEWEALARTLESVRGTTPVVLAGGLRPENVATAIRLLSPDVVDVSSGVERVPGEKDHSRMRAFMDAVRGSRT